MVCQRKRRSVDRPLQIAVPCGMRFKVQHRFEQIDLTTFESLYFDEAFNVEMCQAVAMGRTLLARSITAGQLLREVQVSPERSLPGPVAKLLGAQQLSYVEAVNYRFGSFAGTWQTTPNVMADKVTSAGTFAFAQDKDGVVRTVEGEVNVRIFGVGGVIERFIVADVEKSYETAAEFTRAFLASTR